MSARIRFCGWRARLATLGIALLHAQAGAETVFTHVHLRVADPAAAAEWYRTLFGGEIGRGGPGPSVRFMTGFIGTMPNDGPAPSSSGGVIDHFGVWVADVDAAIDQARRLGATVDAEPAAARPGGPVVAFIVDPWGTRVELVEGAAQVGVNHVHVVARDADAVRDWFVDVFDGRFDPERGGNRFHGVGFGDIWVHITEAADAGTKPSRGRSLDHLGLRLPLAVAAFGERIEAAGYPPYLIRPNPPGSDLLFFEGPGGIHFEIAESPSR